MPGNPFRRAPVPADEQQIQRPRQSSLVTGRDGASDGSTRLIVERRASTKRVRIQTPPPLSPASVHDGSDYYGAQSEDESPDGESPEASIFRVSEEAHEGSPPPDPLRMAFGGSSEVQIPQGPDPEVIDNTRRNSATGSSTTVAGSIDVPIIRNPFERTLATMNSTGPAPVQESSNEPGTRGKGLDVDAFKRLLMTGSSAASGQDSPSISNTSTSNLTNDGSSADLSGAQASTLESASPTDDEKEEYRAPLPKLRQGGLPIHSRTPQTVSFDSFNAVPLLPAERPSSQGSISSKPPPPAPRISSRHSDSARSSLDEPNSHDAGPTAGRRPAPPVSRRSSQRNSLQTVPQLPPTQVGPVSPGPIVNGPTTSAPLPPALAKKPPPPPPSRRGARPPAQSRGEEGSTQAKLIPPPPPRRRRGSSVSVSTEGRGSSESTRHAGGPAAGLTDPSPATSALLQDMDRLQAEIEVLRQGRQ